MRLEGILFDKDGTLFDFEGTWGLWAGQAIETLGQGDAALTAAIGEALGYDLVARAFLPGSAVIAGTVGDLAALLRPIMPERSEAEIIAEFNALAADVAQVEVTPLPGFIDTLRRLGLKVGVATNDAEISARSHLASVGVLERLDFLAGYDSGHGAKPGPGQLLAFAERFGIAPGRVAMVGDSTHDLIAARAARMVSVAVLTGPAREAELAPHADVVLPTIASIPDWLEG